mmetsp:Transcript_22134/g.47785  ORF Transcript_22134/g.47785 Transcript_22134/m.47785 type:complete len:203 (-) Transcript_22134:407-1015(-)
MQLYQPAPRQGMPLPARVHMADGGLFVLGMPNGRSSRGDDGDRRSRTENNNALGGGSVLLFPQGEQWAEHMASRIFLFVVLLADAIFLIALLSELTWRTLYRGSLLSIGVSGLLTVMLGMAGCYFPWPRLLGFLATLAVLQFFFSTVLVQSIAQTLHFAMQPLVLLTALELRALLLPSWFSAGRIVRATRVVAERADAAPLR